MGDEVLLYDFRDVLHMHCETCYQMVCKEEENCVMARCLYCSIHMHSCKIDDHETICDLKPGPCINFLYGCPIRLPRKEMAKHLNICPANVVQCGMEWNRYPLYSREKYTLTNIYSTTEHRFKQSIEHWIPFPETNPPKIRGQLDIEMAVSDQRKLLREKLKKMNIGKWKFSRRPQVGRIDKERIRNLEQLMLNKAPVDSFSANANIALSNEVDSNGSEIAEELLNLLVKEDELITREADIKHDNINNDLVNGKQTCNRTVKCDGISEEKENGAFWSKEHKIKPSCNSQKSLEELKIEKEKYLRSEKDKTSVTIADLKEDYKQLEFQEDDIEFPEKPETITNVEGDDEVKANGNDQEELIFTVQVQSEDFHTENEAVLVGSGAAAVPEIPARFYEHLNNALASGLGLNVIIETIPKFQSNYPLYSIPCQVSLRRDQYCSHFKNIHDDIHGGLNYWIQHRCPLAQYGCTYIRHRLRPGSTEGCIVFDHDIDNFGVKPTNKSIRSEEYYGFNLMCLPAELIESIVIFLDSFSINQFSKTCRTAREVCRCLLQRRGIVTLEWERDYYCDGTVSWRVRKKRWSFTPSFSPITSWHFTDEPPIGEHLKKCQFFYRLPRKQRLRLPMADLRRVKLKSEWRSSDTEG